MVFAVLAGRPHNIRLQRLLLLLNLVGAILGLGKLVTVGQVYLPKHVALFKATQCLLWRPVSIPEASGCMLSRLPTCSIGHECNLA